MERIDEINRNFFTLFQEGRELLRKDVGAVMDAQREKALEEFKAHGIPYGHENYRYANLLPVLERDYNVSLRYVEQEVDLSEVFQCNVPCLDTHLLLTINGRVWRGNERPDVPEGVIVCGLAEASVKYKELFDKYYNQFTEPGRADGLVDCDFCQPQEPQRIDNIASACAASGMLKLARLVGDGRGDAYREAALRMLRALDALCADWTNQSPGILQKCTAAYHDEGAGRHVNILYGDYFFVEALLRLRGADAQLWQA